MLDPITYLVFHFYGPFTRWICEIHLEDLGAKLTVNKLVVKHESINECGIVCGRYLRKTCTDTLSADGPASQQLTLNDYLWA